jgi:polyphosphate glucokinase
MHAFGIDIGGTGIKAAPVDLDTGKLLAERQKIATPHPAVPDAVADIVRKLTVSFGWHGPTGITFPGVVVGGVTRTAANLDPAWIGLDAEGLLAKAAGQPVRLLNDADAAGVAEMTFGAGTGEAGTVLMVTFGTGIGTALFVDGILVPNTEFGHLEIRGKDAEKRASEHAKTTQGMTWKQWAKHVDEYLEHLEALLSPDLIIIGGGISKEADKFVPLLTGVQARIVPAAMLNDAGIVGAAMAAHPESLAPHKAGRGATATAAGACAPFPSPGLPELPGPGARRYLTGCPAARSPSLTWAMRSVPKWKTLAASTASAPAPTAGAKCATSPAPPLAITGTVTTARTARISSRSKPAVVPSASIELSRISPAPSSAPRRAHSTASMPVPRRPPCVVTSNPLGGGGPSLPVTRRASTDRTTHWEPNRRAASASSSGRAMAAVFSETLSAPVRSSRSMSSSLRMPPPTVSGMNTCSAVRRTTSYMVSRPPLDAVMSRNVSSSAPSAS